MEFMRIANGKLCGFAVAGRNDEDPRWKDDLNLLRENTHKTRILGPNTAWYHSIQPANSVRDKHINM